MSSNKTSNYNLHSWEINDEFHVSEINENFDLLDQVIKAESEGTNAAMSAATEALNTQVSQRPRMIYGSYVGNGNDSGQIVSLGLRPKAVLAVATDVAVSGAPFHHLCVEGCRTYSITLTDTGFVVYNRINGNMGAYMNYSSQEYLYLALY